MKSRTLIIFYYYLLIHSFNVCFHLSLSGIYRELCLESVKNKHECETQAACQHWEVRQTHAHAHFCTSVLVKTFIGKMIR